MSKIVTAIQNDTINSICWRYYGRSTGVVEKVLESNSNLAEFDVFLPIGTSVYLPDIDTPQQTRTTIQLWD